MQETALDNFGTITASEAHKQKNYLCPECGFPVRLRKGSQRSAHFYHIHAPRSCRQAKKGLIHIKLQQHICQLLQDQGAQMEVRFPSHGRIADVACSVTKKIIEIQYSPISLKEVKKRCQDYESLGYQIIWVLHDHRFNKRVASPAEKFLRGYKTCYYTNFNVIGQGDIYDRLRRGHHTPVDLSIDRDVPLFNIIAGRRWTLCHQGDWIYRVLDNEKIPSSSYNFYSLRDMYETWIDELLEQFVAED